MAIWYRGLCFLPTDDELFFNYLMRRLNREPLPDPDVVRDCDVYGGGDPWKIFGKDRDEKFYVFTTLKKKNKSRVDRTAGSGTWKGEQSYKIRGSQGEVVGYKKLFTFEPKASSSGEADKAENGHWIMYEYSKHPHNETECVLCVISNKYVCRNPHGRVQFEEENRQAKKARPLRDDHTVIDVPSTTSPPSTTATVQAQPSTSPAFDEDEVVIPQNGICRATESPAFHSDRNANALPPTAANIREDTRLTASSAFGGANAGPLSPTAAPMVDPEWADQLKNMEISPLVKCLLCTVVKQRARAPHARNNVLESHPEEIAPNWPY
ncbi:NAC domain-containing protein 68-like [Syzygium oleosum]|uniref:NAC domain-containing protein 68-like n=1 Tax=Syzygium oleosum TaxID=219896 RepID=UPI0024B89151|nr:NAC domain-containing protein 68-like [Syzygium oleosum]